MEALAPYDPELDRVSRRDRQLLAVLVICALVVYWQVRKFEFLGLDDQLYVGSNAYITGGFSVESFRWALSATPNDNWHPLTTVIQLLIATFLGTGPAPFHWVNMLLHALNVALLYLFLRRASGLVWPAFFTALLWGLHPQRVESVAWISELKDVVFGAFWLGALLAYIRYSHRRTAGNYALVIGLYILALLGKPMAVTLGPLLLLLDAWPLSRARMGQTLAPPGAWWMRRALEKLPMLLLALGDVYAQPNGRKWASGGTQFPGRIQNGVVSYVDYLRDIFFPHHLHVLYPHPYLAHQPISVTAVTGSAILLVAISVICTLLIHRKPYLFVGWFWFIGTMVPVIGLIQVGEQARADRFSYMPAVGLIMAVVWLVYDLTGEKRAARNIGALAGVAAAIALAVVTWLDLPRWHDTGALFRDLYRLDPGNFFAQTQEGYLLYTAGDKQRGMQLLESAVTIAPTSNTAQAAYGAVLLKEGRLEKAKAAYVQAVLGYPSGNNWDGMGQVCDALANKAHAEQNPVDELKFRKLAIGAFDQAIKNDDANPEWGDHLAYQIMAVYSITHSTADIDHAIAVWQQVVAMSPGFALAHGHLADALRIKRDTIGAIEHYRAAIAAGSKNPEWETYVAWYTAIDPRLQAGDVQQVVDIARDACDQTNHQDAAALDAYAACLARLARYDDAVIAAQQAIAQANAAHQPAVAADITKRLALYQKQEMYVLLPATQPTTNPTTEPVLGPQM